MTDAQYAKLVADFKATMERGEKDQWKLAEIAWLAIDGQGTKPKVFAADTGYAVETIRQYRGAHKWTLENPGSDRVFGDVWTLSNLSAERGDAVQILAELDGKSISTVKADTNGINSLREFMENNQELMTEALKDEDTRKATIGAAFAAASEGVVAEATRHTKEAAKPKPKRNVMTDNLTDLRHKTVNSGIWGKTNLPMITDMLNSYEAHIDAEHIELYMYNLAEAKDAMDIVWETLERMKADVKV